LRPSAGKAKALCSLAILLFSFVFPQTYGRNVSRPNILLIMADDLGYGDLGCFGNDTIRTPNTDQLAKEGMRLTHHIAAASLCTPSRAAFLTGRYPIRSGMESRGGPRVILRTGSSGGLPANETTFAKLLQQQGYTTGLIGKWHLGMNCESRNDHCHHPLNHGFDSFYGTPFTLVNECQPSKDPEISSALQATYWFYTQIIAFLAFTLLLGKMIGLFSVKWKIIAFVILSGILFFISWFSNYGFARYWNCIMLRDYIITEQPIKLENAASRIVKESISFIERNKQGPFLLFVSFLHLTEGSSVDPSCFGTSISILYGVTIKTADSQLHKWILQRQQNHQRLNSSTGQGGKGMGGWEGGIRVPGIVRWPGMVPANTLLDEPISLMDIYPTVAHLAGASVPQDRIIDGKNQIALLLGAAQHSEHEFMFHYCGVYLHAVRWYQKETGALWKVHYMTPTFEPEGAGACYTKGLCGCAGEMVTNYNPPLLFDLLHDPSEANPLSPTAEPLFNTIVSHIEKAVVEHRKTVAPVPEQLNVDNTVWKPWLQPCCGTFPFCWCDDESSSDPIIV
uniref:Sulfatase N-terminal domain-containing protein n=1 Tax=Varanus komodoensis TaxID=61221 RepID=A0A8D2L0G8_VARKO